MSEIKETKLPGVGIRYEFKTDEGIDVEVVSHRSGRREVYLADREDPDEFKRVLSMNANDARTLGELLGVSRVAEQLSELQHQIEGLVIDWLPLRVDSGFAGKPLGDARIRTQTGVSVVAILRGDRAIAAPGPDELIQADDYLVVVGTGRGIEQVVELLHPA